MHSIKDLQSIISQHIDKQEFIKHPPELYEPIHYTMSQGGKRLRPVLTLMACELFGGNIEKALYPALAIEVFHNFTLVHDDIMDNAPLRRGKETVYRKWNQNIAILSGDTMFALAYQYALKTDVGFVPKILEVFNKAAIEVCEGQQLDMNFESIQEVSISEYLEMIRLKTAVLIDVSLQIGAIIGEADPEDIQAISEFGLNLGIAFQLKDDFLDVYGEEESFGKQNGGDIVSCKKTFLYLKALELCDQEQRNKLQTLYLNPDIDPVKKFTEVKSIFDAIQIDTVVDEVMTAYYKKAMECLDKIKVNTDRKQILRGLAEQMYGRNY